ncbi:MAG: preprotein translocase subunit SecY [Patescibacteria group bacterium]|nr:preprotein translocase subunit SecY [Patescibacteria group bacterium]
MNILQKILSIPDLRKKILFTLGIILLTRLIAHITVPGIDRAALANLADSGGALGVFSIFTGGSLENFSIVLMGLGPYINASIIIQLLSVVVPKLEALSEEGQEGRRKMNQYTRWLSIPLALLQSYGMILLLNKSAGGGIVADVTNFGTMLPIMISVTAGTMLFVWLGDLISEKGVGNGTSIIIFINIIASVPLAIWQNLSKTQFDSSAYIPFLLLIAFTIILTIIVILFSEGERRVPVTYAARGGRANSQSTLPMRVNQAGMIPIIFAMSIIVFPSVLASFFVDAKTAWIRETAKAMADPFSSTGWTYIIVYFVLVVLFTYFYTSITFKPKEIAENIQKRGGFVAGLRPGKQTSDFLSQISLRLNLWGGLFLAIVAALPLVIQNVFTELHLGAVTLLISGAGLIIIVGVVLDLLRQINSHLQMNEYDKIF